MRKPQALMIGCFLLSFALLNAQINFSKPYEDYPIYEATLKNGLRIIIYKDSTTPIISSQLWFNVGSIYDPPSRSGLSHLLEHMDGTKNYKPREITQIIDSLGGEDNAFTSNLYVCYWVDLTKEFYDTALKLLAERLANLLITEEKFLSERNVVMEERRLGENEPYDVLWEQFDLLAYRFHPFRNPVIGWMEDIKRITLKDLINHYQTYYQPQNAILVLAGDVDIERALAQVNKYFGKIKSKPVSHPKFYEPPQAGEQSLVLYRKVSLPAVLLGYRTADSLDQEYYALEVLEGLLSWGKDARLYKKLVEEKNLALRVWAYNDLEREAGTFKFFVVPKKLEYLDTIIALIYKELEHLMSLGPDSITDFEMARITNNIIANEIYSRDRVRGMGMRIGRQLIVSGSLDDMVSYPERIKQVTKEDVREILRKYFVPKNRTIVKLLPEDEKK
ncbi:MAG: pitrilysin family protein [candidate division WOR-3 bacterium]